MSAALDVEQCAGCSKVQICTRWNPAGTWDYTKGTDPCRPVKIYTRPRIIEEPIPSRIAPVIDAEQVQRDRFRLRDQK